VRAIAELVFGSQRVEAAETAQAWLQENLDADTATIYQELVQRAAPRSLVDASCIYVSDPNALTRIEIAFPGARYLHLLRHPAATCESIQASFPRLNLKPDRSWLLPHVDILEFLEGILPERHVRLRIEDLLEATDFYLKQIAEWLEIRIDSRCIKAMRHPERSRFASYGPVNAKFGNDPEFLKNPVLGHDGSRFLSCPLSWDPDIILSEDVKQYARLFGYR